MPVPSTKKTMAHRDDNSRHEETDIEVTDAHKREKNESMILVQVNPGETFTIQAENHTQCITGPAQVPMVSPNGAIPPIQVPHGYISHVIEDQQGFRKVVVIPESSAQVDIGFEAQTLPPLPQQCTSPSLSLQSGQSIDYRHQVSRIQFSDRAALMYATDAEHLAMFHSSPFYTPSERSSVSGGNWTLEDYLSCVTKPEVYDVQQRSIHLKWSMDDVPPRNLDMPAGRITYGIYIMQQGRGDCRFNLAKRECNTFTEIKDLKPGIEYHVKLLAEMSAVKGKFSEVTKFCTKSCQPDTPRAPKMTQFTKNSIALKWNAPNDNGEKIIQYHLEWDEGEKGSGFRSLFLDKKKQCFYKVNKLTPSHCYTFRLKCMNGIGESPWSPEVTYKTSGVIPPVPEAPQLCEAFVRSLSIFWSRSTGTYDSGCGTYFTLEMDDGMGYGFKPVYYGSDLKSNIKNLHRSTWYKFRLQAHNNEGKSGYSATACFLTLPDKPGAPEKVKLKGKVHPTWFKVSWDPPLDNGGSEITMYVLECSYEKGQAMETVYTGPEVEFVLGNVRPGQTCSLRVYCVSSGGTSAPSKITFVSSPSVIPGRCAPPRAISKPESDILLLQWDPPDYDGGSTIMQYELAKESNLPEHNNLLKTIYRGPGLGYSIAGLKRGTIYKFFLRAMNRVGGSDWSEPLEIETSPGPPDKPEPPDHEAVTPSSILLRWKKPQHNASEINAYLVEWGREDSTMTAQLVNIVTSFEFSGLLPDNVYFFRVQAHNAVGSSPFSDVTAVRTMTACPGSIDKIYQSEILPIVNDMEELERDEDGTNESQIPKPSTSARICWTIPATHGSAIHRYVLEVTSIDLKERNLQSTEQGPLLIKLNGDDSEHLLENLHPDSEYRVRIKAVNEIGSGPFSHPIIIKTQPLPPNPPVIECACSFSSLKLKWDDDGDNFYHLQMREKHGRFMTIYSGFGQSYKVNRLSERTSYCFRINAHNDAGKGPFSPTFCFTTIAAPPPQLKSPLSVSLQEDYADISWSEAGRGKGDDFSYILNAESYDQLFVKRAIPLKQSKCRISPIRPGTRYRVQVAVVRHLKPIKPSKLQDVVAQLEGGKHISSSSKPAQLDVNLVKSENVIGQFSEWFIFDSPVHKPIHHACESNNAIGDMENLPVGTALSNASAYLSDEATAALFLTLIFFVSAVFVASVTQIFRV